MKLPEIVRQGLLHRCTLSRDRSAGWYHISDESADEVIVYVSLVTGMGSNDYIADYRGTYPDTTNVSRRHRRAAGFTITAGFTISSFAEDNTRAQVDIVGLTKFIKSKN